MNVFNICNTIDFFRFLLYHEVLEFWSNQTFGFGFMQYVLYVCTSYRGNMRSAYPGNMYMTESMFKKFRKKNVSYI